MNRLLSVFLLVTMAFCLQTRVFGQDLPKAKGFTLDRFYRYPLINGRSPAAPAMSPDGSKIVFGWNKTGARRLDVWTMDYPSGAVKQIVDSSKIDPFPRQDDERTEDQKREEKQYDAGISGFHWSPDGREIMFGYKGRAWLAAPDGSHLRPLIDTAEQVSTPDYSPDGRYIGFLRGSNVFRIDRSSGAIKQMTFLSKAGTRVDGFTFSPDGKDLLISWSDESKLGNHVMMDFTKDRATVVNIQRMWQGEKSVNVQVGIVSVEGGLVRFLTGIPRYTWLKELKWAPDSRHIAIGAYSEDFQKYWIWVIDRQTLRKWTLIEEKAPKNYLPDWRPLVWSRDGKEVIYGTDIIEGKFGFRSVFSAPIGLGQPKPLYAKNHDVASLSRPKNSDRIILVTMARSPLTTEINILEPDGRLTSHTPIEHGMATEKEFDEAAAPMASEDGTKIATLANDRTTPRELYALEPVERRLTKSTLPEFERVQWANHEEVTLPGPDGVPIHGVLITRKGFDKSRKHPAFISSMYANSAKLAWNGYFENYAATELDMAVLQVDFRASWGYGGEFNSGYYKSMGLIDSDEAVKAKEYLVSLGFVRPDRVGVWGWSYGGFLTCMIMLTKPDAFDTGVAVASVTDWRSYNEWYTRRRLGLESDEKEVYKKTSPISYAEGLRNNLLLVHGLLDDNVLFQDTVRLMQRMIDKGKYFDFMPYPRDDHSIGHDESRPHVMVTVMRYLWRQLSRP